MRNRNWENETQDVLGIITATNTASEKNRWEGFKVSGDCSDMERRPTWHNRKQVKNRTRTYGQSSPNNKPKVGIVPWAKYLWYLGKEKTCQVRIK